MIFAGNTLYVIFIDMELGSALIRRGLTLKTTYEQIDSNRERRNQYVKSDI